MVSLTFISTYKSNCWLTVNTVRGDYKFQSLPRSLRIVIMLETRLEQDWDMKNSSWFVTTISNLTWCVLPRSMLNRPELILAIFSLSLSGWVSSVTWILSSILILTIFYPISQWVSVLSSEGLHLFWVLPFPAQFLRMWVSCHLDPFIYSDSCHFFPTSQWVSVLSPESLHLFWFLQFSTQFLRMWVSCHLNPFIYSDSCHVLLNSSGGECPVIWIPSSILSLAQFLSHIVKLHCSDRHCPPNIRKTLNVWLDTNSVSCATNIVEWCIDGANSSLPSAVKGLPECDGSVNQR